MEVMEYLRDYLRENESVAISSLASVYISMVELDLVMSRMSGQPVGSLKLCSWFLTKVMPVMN
jgi:hypothetical protein